MEFLIPRLAFCREWHFAGSMAHPPPDKLASHS
jgi:hypothetical protein